MDVVVEKLESASISTNSSTSLQSLYKNWGKLDNQEERRQELLEVQKRNRHSNLDKVRGILDLDACEDTDYFKSHKKTYYRPKAYVAGFNIEHSYNNVLTMSEWMVERPSDFEENWVVVASPKAGRVLVIAKHGTTRVYNKHGYFMFECRTALPGGNPGDQKSKSRWCCVLDCFYQKKEKIMHVLDVLAWNTQIMADGELEFRDYWLRSQFFELDALRALNNNNQLIFSVLPKVSCAPEYFNNFMMKVHFKPTADDVTTLDGLLFYHKKAKYISGETPLVGWLFPFMVPEVLGSHITVNSAYMIQMPEKYTNQADYIIEFNNKLKKKSCWKKKCINEMDTSDIGQTESISSATGMECTLMTSPPTQPEESQLESAESMCAEAGPEVTDENTPDNVLALCAEIAMTAAAAMNARTTIDTTVSQC